MKVYIFYITRKLCDPKLTPHFPVEIINLQNGMEGGKVKEM